MAPHEPTQGPRLPFHVLMPTGIYGLARAMPLSRAGDKVSARVTPFGYLKLRYCLR